MMESLKMTFDLLWLICGPAYLILTILLGVILTVASIYLVFVRRSPQMLGVFLPMTFFPLFVGAFRSLLALSAAIGLLRDSGTSTGSDVGEGVMLMGMSLLPLLFSLIASLPAFLIIAAGRAQIVWRANASIAKPAPTKTSSRQRATAKDDFDVQDEAEKYLSRISGRD